MSGFGFYRSYGYIKEEEVELRPRHKIDFEGGGITATDDDVYKETDVTVPLGAGIVMPADPGDNLKFAYAWVGNFAWSADLRTNGNYINWIPTALTPAINQQGLTVVGTGQTMTINSQDALTVGAGANVGGGLIVRAGNTAGGVASNTGGSITVRGGNVVSGAGGTGLGGNIYLAPGNSTGAGTNTYGNLVLCAVAAPAWNSMQNGVYLADAIAQPVALALGGSYLWSWGTQLNPIATATKNGFESAAGYVRIWGTTGAAVSVAIGAGYVDIFTTTALLTVKNTSTMIEMDVTTNRALASLITRFGSLKCGVAWLDDNTLTIESLDNNLVASGAAPAVTGAFGSGVGWRLTFNAGHTVTLAIQQDAAIARSVNWHWWFAATDTQVAP